MSDDGRPFPPGDYPLVVVRTGPGGMQLSYSLRSLGIEHALISQDEGPAGMFLRFAMFGRLITCSRPQTPVQNGCPASFRFDCNSMVTDVPEHQALVPEFMQEDNYLPAREEIALAYAAFARRARLQARYGCRWESTRRADDGRFVLSTSDGEYRAALVVFAVGMIEPWRPATPGIEAVPHYVDVAARPLEDFRGKRVMVIGKRNSGFEIAHGLLAHARQIVIGSPHPVRPSIVTGCPTPPRARYVQPLEDHMFGGGTFGIDISLDRIERTADRWRVQAQGTTKPGEIVVEAAYWESTTVPGIYFAGAPTQGQAGMRKYGWPSHSARSAGFASTRSSRRGTSPRSTSASRRRGPRSIRRGPWTTCSSRRPGSRRSGVRSPTSAGCSPTSTAPSATTASCRSRSSSTPRAPTP